MKKQTHTTQTEDTAEYCVICGTKTEYTIKTPVYQRIGYIHGAGQLCRECYADIYPSKKGELP